MKCDISIEVLNAYLDNELDEQDHKRVQVHIASCPQCQQELASLKALDAHVRESEIEGPSREFMFRLNRNVMERVRKRRRASIFRFAPVFVPVAVAALILLVVVHAPQPERLISLDDQVVYTEKEYARTTETKDLDLQLPELSTHDVDGVCRDAPTGGYAAKKAAPEEAPPAPVVSKSGERISSIEQEYAADADDKREKSYGELVFDEVTIPRNQIVRAIVDTSGNIVKVATGNTIVPETDTVLENCLKGRQVQVPMVGGRRTQMYIDFTQDAEDTQNQ
jgi:hypothetical protein